VERLLTPSNLSLLVEDQDRSPVVLGTTNYYAARSIDWEPRRIRRFGVLGPA